MAMTDEEKLTRQEERIKELSKDITKIRTAVNGCISYINDNGNGGSDTGIPNLVRRLIAENVRQQTIWGDGLRRDLHNIVYQQIMNQIRQTDFTTDPVDNFLTVCEKHKVTVTEAMICALLQGLSYTKWKQLSEDGLTERRKNR